VNRFVEHIRRLWPRELEGSGAPLETRIGLGVLLPLPFVAWALVALARHTFRGEHVAFLAVVPLLAYATPASKKLFVGLYPVGLLGLVYDSMRFVKNWGLTEGRVHDCDLRAIDMALFGVDLGGGVRGTVHDWLQSHASAPLDVVCAVPYATFIYAAIGFAGFLYVREYPAMQRFAWTFLALNLAGFVTYHVYPAAPPWYFHAHGCAVDLASAASEGPNLARVDKMLGVPYFAGFYGRASDVFGAVPSLHVAYPLLICLLGWRHFGVAMRAASAAFFALMCFSAVYLDHHWIVDVLVGIVYTLTADAVGRWVTRRRNAQAVAPVAALESS